MWVILEFSKSSTHEWAVASAFHATSQPAFLYPQVYLIGNPFYLLLPFLCFSSAATASSPLRRSSAMIHLKRIYNFLSSMLVYTPFALCFVTLRDIFMHFPELTY
jgi:hypothetical protein